jgi:hypothetical protein
VLAGVGEPILANARRHAASAAAKLRKSGDETHRERSNEMNKRSRNSTTIIDKLLEDIRSKAVSFVLSTGLIASFGYLLLTLPAERQELKRELMTFNNLALEVAQSPLQDVVTIATANANNEDAIQRTNEILTGIANNAAAQHLNSDFVTASDKWLSSTMNQLEMDRGRVNGFEFTDAVEQALQQDIVAILDGRRDVLAGIREIITRWDTENGAARDGRLETVATVLRQTQGRSAGIESRAQQLMSATKIAQAQSVQTADELDERINLVERQLLLAAAGVTVGLGLVGWTIVATARKRR